MVDNSSKKLKSEYDLVPGDFNTSRRPTWCTGCGNFGIWNALKKTFVRMSLYPHQVLIVYGIGCSGNGANFLKTYSFHALHGRTLPVATGARLSNHKLTVIAEGGDGDGVGIGGNHFIHTCRRNINITYIMHDNRVYGLTTGQASPTSDRGFKTRSTPDGVLENPVEPLTLALASGATFVARGFSGDVNHLTDIFQKAIKHRGFSFIDVLQPCVTFNKQNTYDFYRQGIYKLEEEKNYNCGNIEMAFRKSLEVGRLPVGVFYQTDKPIYEDGLKQIERKPLVDHIISEIDISKLLNRYS
ncbi:MAG: 2-oxoacid:ferredoxin oxidoreductase subunit beta [Actinobacteria bacterium]|nr:2-oxoacid:ferredoxin oxidoreductase subunit beta [Actinomycetota bacterium]